jgi:transposase
VLRAYPGPQALLQAPRRPLLALLKRESLGHRKRETMDRLLEVARTTVALPAAQGAMREEIPLIVERLELYERQMAVLEAQMVALTQDLPAARALVTVPNMGPVSAASFLGSIGDPRAYDSSRQIVALAGLTLVERSSGISKGEKRISKRGRPALRKHAHLFAVRSVHRSGIFRGEYEALLARNGRRTIPALTAIARRGLRLLYSIAREERAWTPEPPASGARHRA